MALVLNPAHKLLGLLEADLKRPSQFADIEPLRDDPTLVFRPLRIEADPWQKEVLGSTASKILLLCSRQSGKSECAAAVAMVDALIHPHSEILIISRTLRQASELMRKVKELWRGLIGGNVARRWKMKPRSVAPQASRDMGLVETDGWDAAATFIGNDFSGKVKDKALSMELPNGSRITALPGSPDTIVGFSAVTLLIIDEASRVPDNLYKVARGYQASTEAVHGRPGRMVVASTPFGKRGWFYDAWVSCEKAESAYNRGIADSLEGVRIPRGYSGEDSWLTRHYILGYEGKNPEPPFQTFRVTADQCPRIPKEFLEEERVQIGERWFMQEFHCEFVDTIDSVFSHDLIQSLLKPEGEQKKLWFE